MASRGSLADEGPPETTALRLPHDPAACLAPLYIAGDLLRAEGFTDIRYVASPEYSPEHSVSRGVVDFDFLTPTWAASHLDAGHPVTVLAGVHSGCLELFAHEPIRTIRDLKDKRVGVQDIGSPVHLYLVVMAAQVGLDPREDIEWVTRPDGGFTELFASGEIDAFLGFPPEPQELRARGFSRIVLNTATDKPWSQYFCCMAVGGRAFVRDHPVATKRFLRAILKAADICADQPEMAAQRVVDGRRHGPDQAGRLTRFTGVGKRGLPARRRISPQRSRARWPEKFRAAHSGRPPPLSARRPPELSRT